jgi:hypothetical protein
MNTPTTTTETKSKPILIPRTDAHSLAIPIPPLKLFPEKPRSISINDKLEITIYASLCIPKIIEEIQNYFRQESLQKLSGKKLLIFEQTLKLKNSDSISVQLIAHYTPDQITISPRLLSSKSFPPKEINEGNTDTQLYKEIMQTIRPSLEHCLNHFTEIIKITT